MKRVLVVEDEASIREMVALNLKMAGWEVIEAPSAERALELMHGGEPCDAALLDIMLPGMDGLDLLRAVRAEQPELRVLILSARAEVSDRVAGLDLGADDYLTKPFDPEELCARLRALTRRTGEVVLDSVSYGDLELGLADLELKCADKAVRLSQREGAVMELLMRSPQNVFSKQALLTRVWGTEGETGVNNVEAYISFLRKKLAFLKSNVSIDTIRMLGYRLSCPEDCKA